MNTHPIFYYTLAYTTYIQSPFYSILHTTMTDNYAVQRTINKLVSCFLLQFVRFLSAQIYCYQTFRKVIVFDIFNKLMTQLLLYVTVTNYLLLSLEYVTCLFAPFLFVKSSFFSRCFPFSKLMYQFVSQPELPPGFHCHIFITLYSRYHRKEIDHFIVFLKGILHR